MDDNKIYIKHMVCPRCVMTARKIFNDCGITPLNVELGVVTLADPVGGEKLDELRKSLEEYGFELIDDRRRQIVEQIRVGVIEYVRQPELREKMNLSQWLCHKCRRDYSYISKLYTEINGISIEKYYIAQRVELVKELLIYGELTVSEIAYTIGYSSVAHLSAQFKSVTGLSPTQFKQLKHPRISPIDQL